MEIRGMKFPVDLLVDVSQAELQRLAHNYMNDLLLYSNPDLPERLTLPDSTEITIDVSSVGFIPLYGSSDKQRILALFSPNDPLTAVALYLLDQWWTVNDILKTADPARDGAVEVGTVGERIVLYILNRVIYRAKEMSSEEIPFLCHGEKDHTKILWNNGEAVGFYSVKPSGSLCNSFSNRTYQLPVMDSIFVRKSQRGKGFGLLMLEDFVLSYKDYYLGLRYPLSKSMYKVCEKYLCQYPSDTDLLWEVEGIGGLNQRTKISSKIQTMGLSVFKRLSLTEESVMITEVTGKEMMEEITTKITEPSSMECTVETVEEVTVLTVIKDAELLVSARNRSSGSKQIRNIKENITSEKVIRIEDIEAEMPRGDHVPAQQKTEIPDVSELEQTEGVLSVSPEGNGEYVVDHIPEGEAVMVSDKPNTVVTSQEPEEADVTTVPTKEEQQVINTSQVLNNTPHDSQITVENVASEIEEHGEECQKEDTTELLVSEEVLKVHRDAEAVTKLGEVTQIEVSDEKFEEIITQQDLNLEIKVLENSALTAPVEENQSAVLEICTDLKADSLAVDDGEENLVLVEVDEDMICEEKEAPVGTRTLRSVTKIVTATPKHKTRSRKQVDKQETENSEEEPTVTTRRSCKQIQEEEQKGTGEGVEETGEEEKAVERAAVGNAVTETLEENGEEMGDEAVSQREENLEPGIHAEAENAVAEEGQVEVEDQSEVISKTFEQQEVETSGEVWDETQPTMGDEEVELSPVAVTRSRTSVGKTELGSAKEPPTKGKAPEEDEIEVENEEPETVEVDKGVSDKGPTTMTEEEEKTAGLTDDTVPEDTLLPKCDEATVSAEEQCSKEMVPQLSDLQRVTVILVDLKNSHHDIHKEMATLEQGVCVEMTAPEEEDEQKEEGMKEEEQMAKEHVQEEGGRLEANDATQQVKHYEPEMGRESVDAVRMSDVQGISSEIVAVEDTVSQSGQLADDGKTSDDVTDEAVTTQATVEGEQSEQVLLSAKDDKEKGVSEEEEATVIETRLLKSGEKTVRDTTKSKSTKTDEQEEAGEERRVLRKGRRPAAATPRRKSKRARTRYQPVEEEESSPSDEIHVEDPQAHENLDENDKEPITLKEEKTTDVEEHIADEKEDNGDEMMEENDVEGPVVQTEENSRPEVEVPVGKGVEESPSKDEGKVTDEEEEPILETRLLRSGGNAIKALPSSESSSSQEEEKEQEETVEDKSSDSEEPAVKTRALRKGRRSAATTSTRKSKRARTDTQVEEEKDTTLAEEIQLEETTENNDENKEGNDGVEPIVHKDENIEPEVAMKQVDVVEESLTEQETVEGEQSGVADTSPYVEETPVAEHAQVPPNTHEEEAPIVETGVLRRGHRSASATARRKSRRTRTRYQPEEEEEGTPAEIHEKEDNGDDIMEEKNGEEPVMQKEEDSSPEVEMKKVEVVVEESITGQETAEEEQCNAEMKKLDEVEIKDGSTEEAEVLEKEDNSLADMDETDTDTVKAEGMNSAQEKETTASEISTKVVSQTAFAEEEAIVSDEPVATEETPTLTRTHLEKAQELNDSSLENKEGNLKEQAEKDDSSPTEDNTEEKEMPATSITRGKQREQSSNEKNMGAVGSSSERGNVLNPALDTDEEVETKVSSQKMEQVEQNTSEEEVEPIVIGKKVLRGRTVPSVIITPRSQTRRQSSKVQILEESLSDEEESPVSAQRRHHRKRKSTGVTPTRTFKRHTRI